MTPERHIGFVTCDTVADLTPDDRRAAAALAARGHVVRPVVWTDASIDWAAFDALVLRSCWDYHKQPMAFRAWLDVVERSGTTLLNSVSQARWNMDKRYLRDLQMRGVATVPTHWLEPGAPRTLNEVRRLSGWTDIVVKPAISATAWRLHRLAADIDRWPADLEAHLATNTFLVQPFVTAIADGEWSLMFFDGRFSHAALKRPRAGEFRVQEEFGGRPEAVAPPDGLIEDAVGVLETLPERPLYARVEGVSVNGAFQLLELELLEPVLFFGLCPEAADRFAQALESRLRAGG